MTWNPILRNPVDLPVLQRAMGRDLQRAYDEKGYDTGFTDAYFGLVVALDNASQGIDETTYDSRDAANKVASVTAIDSIVALEHGGAYFVADEMTTMLHRVAKAVPSEITFHPRIFPQEAGFLYLEEPLIFERNAIVGWTWRVSWLQVSDLLYTFETRIAQGDTLNMDEDEEITPESVFIKLLDDGIVVRGTGDEEEVATVAMTFWVDPSHEDDYFLLGERDVADVYWEGKPISSVEDVLHRGVYGVSHFKVAPVAIHHAWFPGGVRIDDCIYGSFPMGVGEVVTNNGSVGRSIEYLPAQESTDIWKFVIATFEMLNSRIVMDRPLHRNEQKQLERAKFNERFRIIRLRKIIRPSAPYEPDQDGYHIDYRYMVPPHWQRYHTKEGIIWKMRDWYIAGPDGGQLLDRETVYQLDR